MSNSLTRFVSKGARYLYLHLWQYRAIEGVHRRRVEQVARRGHARVVFFAFSVPLWKYQHLYEALAADERFTATIVLSPPIDYDDDIKRHDLAALRDYFDKRQIAYIDYDVDSSEPPYDVKGRLDPDVVFYPQPYERLLTPEHDCMAFYDRLVAFYPYSFMTGNGKFNYDFHFHNLAWRLYYACEEHLREAQTTAWNKGRNVRVVGHPNGDDFAAWRGRDPWKKIDDGRERKRLIWAPHFSFIDKFGQLPRANFLWTAHFMLDMAQRYKEFLQIAFKPHPRLMTELYNHPEWGRERTDAYYRQWAEMENTQLETGEYVDLFMSSDAMVHDCASFVVEYYYTHKPVMYISRDIEHFLVGQTALSREAFSHLYIGKDEYEIRDFIETVVMGGDDPRLEERDAFYRRYLEPPAGRTVARNTVDDLVTSLRLPQ